MSDLLTPTELEAMDASARLANLLRLVIGDGPQASNDWAEAAQHIHCIQNMVMAQAAARAYPERFRLLGGGRPVPGFPVIECDPALLG